MAVHTFKLKHFRRCRGRRVRDSRGVPLHREFKISLGSIKRVSKKPRKREKQRGKSCVNRTGAVGREQEVGLPMGLAWLLLHQQPS